VALLIIATAMFLFPLVVSADEWDSLVQQDGQHESLHKAKLLIGWNLINHKYSGHTLVNDERVESSEYEKNLTSNRLHLGLKLPLTQNEKGINLMINTMIPLFPLKNTSDSVMIDFTKFQAVSKLTVLEVELGFEIDL